MNSYKLVFLVFGVSFLLSSCDLLGLSGNNTDTSVPTLAWEYKMSASAGIPVIDNGNVYLPGIELTKLALESGELQWQSTIQQTIDAPGVTNLLLTDNAAIVAQQGIIQALAKTNGARVWQTPVNLVPAEADTGFNAFSLPMVQMSSKIFIGGQNKIVGLDTNNGAISNTIMLDSLAGAQPLNVFSLVSGGSQTGGLLYVSSVPVSDMPSSSGGKLIAVNPANGDIRWRIDISDNGILTDMALVNNQLIILTLTGVKALDPETGDINWQKENIDESVLGSNTQLETDGEAIFINSSSAKVFRLNSTDGAVIWETTVDVEDELGINTSEMVFDEDQLFYPFFTNQQAGIAIIAASDGMVTSKITNSNLENVGLDFSLLGGIDVSTPYLIKQGIVNTYGIKF